MALASFCKDVLVLVQLQQKFTRLFEEALGQLRPFSLE